MSWAWLGHDQTRQGTPPQHLTVESVRAGLNRPLIAPPMPFVGQIPALQFRVIGRISSNRLVGVDARQGAQP